MSLQEYVDKVDESKLPEPLKSTVAAFLDDYQPLLDEPNIIHPMYVRRMLMMMVDNLFSEEPPEHLWWETSLSLAANWARVCGEAGEISLERIEALKPLLQAAFPNDDTTVTLQEITMETVIGIMMLSETLTAPKRRYVGPNLISLAQAHFSDEAWFRAIYAGRMPVGFVMLEIDEETPEYYIWRFMIAEPYHGRGYGRKAMEAIKDHVRTLPNATELYLSYGQGEGSPEGFYKKLGFQETGEVDEDEIVAKIGL